ncbi:MAG: ATP-binding region ATPase domain protein [Anaerosporomusa subterranea]|jgi:hypothetical protein|nr:ATP-binding region ATPase domain protein [Anaerosporomusa subterranea]
MRDLALHILDLVQNSVEAGADSVWLSVIEDLTLDLLTIRVVDNGRGMDEDTCHRVSDPFYTTRSTRRVGLGLPLIQMSTSQCGGQLVITSELGRGTTVEASWRWSHLDRPPLGDLATTLKSLIVGNSELDLNYTHQVGRNCFSLSVRELRDTLNGIPFTQPDVLVWLDEYLNGNERLVYGGALDENS